MQTKTYDVLGAMSGTSLDGLDLACCRFTRGGKGDWQFDILEAETLPYPVAWQQKLATLDRASALELALADVALGELIGRQARAFIDRHGLRPLLLASHGHTVFHQPEKGLTLQVGRGAAIAAAAALPVANAFRDLDVALGGQGAPLVPIGDELLFGQYGLCLNLGGIANISFKEEGRRTAYDICPCNMVFNRLAEKTGKPYDEDGAIARHGTPNPMLIEQLDALGFYAQPAPKSLGKEWVDGFFWPLLENSALPVPDLMASCAQHFAGQVGLAAKACREGNMDMLVTGGGAFNGFFVELLRRHCAPVAVSVPPPRTVAFKEAVVFAFLGLLRWLGEPNSLASVTGAANDSCGGALHNC